MWWKTCRYLLGHHRSEPTDQPLSSAVDFPVVSQIIFRLFHWFRHISKLQYNAHAWKKNEISFSSTSLSYSAPVPLSHHFCPCPGLQENFLVTTDKHMPEGHNQLPLSSQPIQGRLETGPSRHRAKSIFQHNPGPCWPWNSRRDLGPTQMTPPLAFPERLTLPRPCLCSRQGPIQPIQLPPTQ